MEKKFISKNNKLRKGFSHNEMNKMLLKGTFLGLSPKLRIAVWISASWKPSYKTTSQIYVDQVTGCHWIQVLIESIHRSNFREKHIDYKT